MAFGQPSGPPASAKQLKTLLALLEAAGYSDFREARGPMGFNQRQGGGKFTKDEADQFIEQLEGASLGEADQHEPIAPPERVVRRAAPQAGSTSAATPRVAADERLTPAQRALRTYPANLLAAELQRRGWIVVEP